MRAVLLLTGMVAVLAACQSEEQKQLTALERRLENELDAYGALLANLQERQREVDAVRKLRRELIAETSFEGVKTTLETLPYVREVTQRPSVNPEHLMLTIRLDTTAPDLARVLSELEDALPPSALLGAEKDRTGLSLEIATIQLAPWLSHARWDFVHENYKPPAVPVRGFPLPGTADQRRRVDDLIVRVEAKYREFDSTEYPDVRRLYYFKKSLENALKAREKYAKTVSLTAQTEAILRTQTNEGTLSWRDAEMARRLATPRPPGPPSPYPP